MKRALLALSLALSLNSVAWSAPAAAPAAATPAPVKTMWDYQKDLGLTDSQIANIKQAVQDLEKTVRGQQERLKPLDTQLNEQIAKEASNEELRATLQQIAAVQIDIRLADVNTSRKINSILSAEQLKQWREIQKTARAAAAKP
jgi:Spy/CpxP family protein refolding chaperone